MSERCPVCGDLPAPVLRDARLSIVRSPGCGLEWRDPLPGPDELAALYGAGYLARWGAADAASLARVRSMKRRTYARVLDTLAPFARTGRLLDVGCSRGFLLELAEERGFEVRGLDLDPEAVAAARERFGERVVCGALGPETFPGLRFDVITLVDVFEHLPHPEALLDAARERLAPGGVLTALLPNAASLVRRLLGRRWPHYAPEHVTYWTPGSLARFLRDRGWELARLRTGFRKTLTAAYLRSTADCVGSWRPPGLGLLGERAFSVPTGEMLAIARPARRAPAGAASAAAAGPAAGSRG